MADHDSEHESRSGPPQAEGSGKAREAAWDDVAAQFSNLGQQVRSRFERRGTSQDAQDASGGGDTVRRWIDTLDDAFTKLGDTVRDPAFRREAGSSIGQLGQALGVTLTELGDKLQGRFGRERAGTDLDSGAGDSGAGVTEPGSGMTDVPPPPSPPPPAPGAEGPPPASPPPTPGADAPPTAGTDEPPSAIPPA